MLTKSCPGALTRGLRTRNPQNGGQKTVLEIGPVPAWSCNMSMLLSAETGAALCSHAQGWHHVVWCRRSRAFPVAEDQKHRAVADFRRRVPGNVELSQVSGPGL